MRFLSAVAGGQRPKKTQVRYIYESEITHQSAIQVDNIIYSISIYTVYIYQYIIKTLLLNASRGQRVQGGGQLQEKMKEKVI